MHDGQPLMLDLVEHNILTPDFELYASDNPDAPVPYAGGRYYRGMIRGDAHSLVALSVFENELIGVISNDAGNFVLGKIKGSQDNLHVLYNDRSLERKFHFECATPEDGVGYTSEQLLSHPQQRDAGDCVRVYIEIDDDIVMDKGGTEEATDYITGLFNQAIALYANENIAMTISEIYAWTTMSPYSGYSASQMLSSYQALTGSFNGDISQLVSYQASGGIAAGYSGYL